MKAIKTVILSAFLTLSTFTVDAMALGERPCLNPFSTIDWSFFFDDLIIGNYGDGSGNPVCACTGKEALGGGEPFVGVKMRITEPIGFAELTDVPYYFPCFQKKSSSIVKQKKRGFSNGRATNENVSEINYRNGHFITYPVFAVLNLFLDQACISMGTIDLPFLGELEPEWFDDFLANMLHPENIMVSNPVAQMACLADCAASTMKHPLEQMTWCRGCWETQKNETGRAEGSQEIVDSAYMATNIIDWMHMSYRMTQGIPVPFSHLPLVDGKTGSASDIACGKRAYFPKIIKSQYFLQPAYPVSTGPISIGMTPIVWSNFKQVPTYSDRIFAIWKRKACCFAVIKTSDLL